MTPQGKTILELVTSDTLAKTFKSGAKTTELWGSIASVAAPLLDSSIDPKYTVPVALAYLVARTGLKWIRAWKSGDYDALQSEIARLREAVEAQEKKAA